MFFSIIKMHTFMAVIPVLNDITKRKLNINRALMSEKKGFSYFLILWEYKTLPSGWDGKLATENVLFCTNFLVYMDQKDKRMCFPKNN